MQTIERVTGKMKIKTEKKMERSHWVELLMLFLGVRTQQHTHSRRIPTCALVTRYVRWLGDDDKSYDVNNEHWTIEQWYHLHRRRCDILVPLYLRQMLKCTHTNRMKMSRPSSNTYFFFIYWLFSYHIYAAAFVLAYKKFFEALTFQNRKSCHRIFVDNRHKIGVML